MAVPGPGDGPLAEHRHDARPDADADADGDGGSGVGLTVGQLARRFGLARSTLLYYDRIGVLSPSTRSAAGYRRFGGADVARLAKIREYRRAGLPLEVISRLLDSGDGGLAEALAARLDELNQEIRHLREQQRFIVGYLAGLGSGGWGGAAGEGTAEPQPFLTSQRFVQLLELAGVDRRRRAVWHAAFERQDAAGHQAFLEFLCLQDDAISRIRAAAAR